MHIYQTILSVNCLILFYIPRCLTIPANLLCMYVFICLSSLPMGTGWPKWAPSCSNLPCHISVVLLIFFLSFESAERRPGVDVRYLAVSALRLAPTLFYLCVCLRTRGSSSTPRRSSFPIEKVAVLRHQGAASMGLGPEGTDVRAARDQALVPV